MISAGYPLRRRVEHSRIQDTSGAQIDRMAIVYKPVPNSLRRLGRAKNSTSPKRLQGYNLSFSGMSLLRESDQNCLKNSRLRAGLAPLTSPSSSCDATVCLKS